MSPSESIYNRIRDKLTEMEYPCCLVLFGPSRGHRTTYRSEHSEAFSISEVADSEAAWALVTGLNWPGWPGDLEVYSIPVTHRVSISEIKNLS